MEMRNVEVVHGVAAEEVRRGFTTKVLRFEKIPLDQHLLVSALYSKAADIWTSPRGVQTMRNYLRFWFYDRKAFELHEQRCAFFIPRFNRLVERQSPLLVVTSVSGDHSMGWHRREEWDGHYDGFELRTRSICLGKLMVDQAMRMRAAAIEQPSEQTKRAFHLSAFMVIVAILHELGHVFGTFVGKGYETPNEIHGVTAAKAPVELTDERGESGEYFERGLFGGELYFDNSNRYRSTPEIPALITSESRDWPLVNVQSIQQLLESPISQDAASPFIRPLRHNGRLTCADDDDETSSIALTPDSGFRTASRETTVSAQEVQREASETHLPSPMPVLPGTAYDRGYLRALVACPWTG